MRFQKTIEILEEGLKDSLAFYAFPELDARKISSTNILERLNEEIRRRTSAVGIFPNQNSSLWLLTTSLMEYAEDWPVSRAYLNPKFIQKLLLTPLNSLPRVPKLRTSFNTASGFTNTNQIRLQS